MKSEINRGLSPIFSYFFWNGAITAAYGYLFNELITQTNRVNGSEQILDKYTKIRYQTETGEVGIIDAYDELFKDYFSFDVPSRPIVKVYDFTKEVGDKLGAAFVNYKFTADVYRTYEIKQNYTKSSYDVSTSVLDTDTGMTSFIRNDTYIVNKPSGDEYRGAKVKVEFGKFKFNR